MNHGYINILFVILDLFKRNKLFKNILIVSSGAAGAQLISLLASPIITRLYSPEAMGILGSFMAILAIILPVAALSYPIAIVLPKTNEEAIKVANNSLVISLVFSVVIIIFLLIFQTELINFVGLEENSTLFLLLSLPIAVLTNILLSIFSQWVIRHKLFMINAKAIVTQSATLNCMKVAFGLFLPLGKFLILSTLVASILQSMFFFFSLKSKKNKNLQLPLNVRFDEKTIKKYKEFPFYRSPQGLLANINQNIPVILLASLFGTMSVGLYVLCRTVLQLPITLIAKPVNDVIYPQINQASLNKTPISPLIFKGTLWLTIFGVVPLMLFIFVGPELFSLVFGESWRKAGEISQWLSVWFYFNFINRVCIAAIPILKLERFLFFNSLFSFILSILGFYVGFEFFNYDVYAIAIYSFFGIIPQIFIVSVVFVAAKKHDNNFEHRIF